jgi:hypothetical protein
MADISYSYRPLKDEEKGMRCPRACGCIGGCRIASGYYPYPIPDLAPDDDSTKIPEMVERVARIIDPGAWAETMLVVTNIWGAESQPPHSEPVGNQLDDLKDKAREKARRVIAALTE